MCEFFANSNSLASEDLAWSDVLMHPETMARIGIAACAYAELKSGCHLDERAVFVNAIPDPSVERAEIIISDLLSNIVLRGWSPRVSVVAVAVPLRVAKRVRILSDEITSCDHEMMRVLLQRAVPMDLDGALVRTGCLLAIDLDGRDHVFHVTSVLSDSTDGAEINEPTSTTARVCAATTFELDSPDRSQAAVAVEQLGLSLPLSQALNVVEGRLLANSDCPHAVLLAGSAGEGKSLLLDAIEHSVRTAASNRAGGTASDAHTAEVQAGADARRAICVVRRSALLLRSLPPSKALDSLRRAFRVAEAERPSVVLIDDVHLLAFDGAKEESRAALSHALALALERTAALCSIAVVGTALTDVPLARTWAQPHRFPVRFEISALSARERVGIVAHELRALVASDADADSAVQACARRLAGASRAEVVSVCAAAAVARSEAGASAQPVGRADAAVSAAIQAKPLRALQSFEAFVPVSTWEEVAGYAELKERLEWSVLRPLQHAKQAGALGISPAKGILLYVTAPCDHRTVPISACVPQQMQHAAHSRTAHLQDAACSIEHAACMRQCTMQP
jgi:hypothetical protein